MKDVKYNVGDEAAQHLGANLYKTIYGVLVEYISNSYDADASYVQILIDRGKKDITIKDDGIGMALNVLESVFLKVGENRRARAGYSERTRKGRWVTGRKGFGKLAHFGFSSKLEIRTVKDNQKSILIVTNQDNSTGYKAEISEVSEHADEPNGTTIILTNCKKRIPEDASLATSIAKRVNLMYEGSEQDPEGFTIRVGEAVVDKRYRDEIILKKDIKFSYKIPEELSKFNLTKEDYKYIIENKIFGTIISRMKTVNIQENKGIVFFARNKLCQEATYLDINPSNSYGYAHLYGELHVDFIDGGPDDNIGTDRTALNRTESTEKLFQVVNSLMSSYARLYDEDENKKKNQVILKIKSTNEYQELENSIANIKDENVQKILNKILGEKINQEARANSAGIRSYFGLKQLVSYIFPTNIIPSGQLRKHDVKDNVLTAYDRLMQYLKTKYKLPQNKDGHDLIGTIYGKDSTLHEFVFDSLVNDTKTNARESLINLGISIVKMRNAINHTNDRRCLQQYIDHNNSKRFVAMIDLFIEIDKLCFKTVDE